MKSTIVMSEVVDNTERKFGSAKQYYPAHVTLPDGTETNAMFTAEQIRTAINRADNNPEDLPKESFWESLF